MRIAFKKGIRAGEALSCSPPGIFIGRESDNDIQILTEGVSLYHSKMMFENGEWIIYDLDSSNGTKVNGLEISAPATLKIGDMVYIGSEAFRIESLENEASEKKNENSIKNDNAIKIRGHIDVKKSVAKKNKVTDKDDEPDEVDEPNKIEKVKKKRKSREEKAKERERNRIIQEIIRKKKRKLTLISIIVAIIANGIIFLWWYSRHKM